MAMPATPAGEAYSLSPPLLQLDGSPEKMPLQVQSQAQAKVDAGLLPVDHCGYPLAWMRNDGR